MPKRLLIFVRSVKIGRHNKALHWRAIPLRFIAAPVSWAAAHVPKKSWEKISRIRTLATERIGNKIGRTSQEKLIQIIEALNELIGA
jgi:hypothetical protein